MESNDSFLQEFGDKNALLAQDEKTLQQKKKEKDKLDKEEQSLMRKAVSSSRTLAAQAAKEDAKKQKDDAQEREMQLKRAMLFELRNMRARYPFLEAQDRKEYTVKDDIGMITAVLSEAKNSVSIFKGREVINLGLESIAKILESLSEAQRIPLKLTGLKDVVHQTESIESIVQELCVKYSYLFVDLKPEFRLALALSQCIFTVHAINSSTGGLIAPTEALRKRVDENAKGIGALGKQKDFKDL